MLKTLAFLAALSISGAALAPPAAAHAVLLEAEPADGAVLGNAPTQILLRFNEPVSPVFIHLIGPTGGPVPGVGAPAAEDNALHLVLPPGLVDGTYFLTYRVISLDSHPVGGTIAFAIGQSTNSPIGPAGASDVGWQLASAIDRVLFYASLFMAAGGAMFAAFVAAGLKQLTNSERRRLSGMAALGIVAALFGIVIEGALSLEGPWGIVFDPTTWRLGLATGLGASFILSIAGLVVLMLSLRHRPSLPPWAGLIGAIVAVASLALSGHAATAEPRWLTAPAVACHVLAVAFWLGSLWPLWQAMRKTARGPAAALLVRFSSRAVPAAGLLLASGGILAVVQLGGIDGLIGTDYGHRLAIKLALAAMLLSLAAINRLWLTPALSDGRPDARQQLRHNIAGEAVLAICILAITATLGQSIPPRALALIPVGYATTLATAELNAAIDVEPARKGGNRITIHLSGPDGKPLSAQEVSIELGDAAAGVEAIRRQAKPIAPGVYEYAGAEMSLAGNWKLRIAVLVSDFKRINLDLVVPIR